MLRSLPLLFLLACLATACSGGSSGGAPLQQDDRTVLLSFRHLVQTRVHARVWRETVLAALSVPTRDLDQTPPPSDECVEVVSVTGSVEDGFVWKVRLRACRDLAGITRTIDGELEFVGAPAEEKRYLGAYTGELSVVWEADPDGGRAAEAARLNAEAARVRLRGSWEIDTFLVGVVQGDAVFSTGAVGVRDDID